LQKEGLLEKSEKRIVPTELGRRFLSDLQERFLTVSVP
jgi:coproporphyrinogen III oxidase-like Fe-S oxidoreductase